jgi:drug/metabolite transporter (DMT)-like permease
MELIGEIAALLTSFLWAGTAVVFTLSGQQVGSVVTNRTRVVFALGFLMLINLAFYRQLLPLTAEPERWLWFSLSGVIGLALGDAFLFQSYLWIGPRLGMLLMSLAPVLGALEAWFIFDEVLLPAQMLGIALTLGGVAWVIIERGDSANPRAPVRGVVFGVLAALGQATGLVLSKQGLLGDFSPISGNLIRMLAAVLALWLVALLQRQASQTVRTLQLHPSAVKLLLLGALIGPTLGVLFSLVAVQHAEVGVASTLMALPPVILLPVSHFFFKERFGWQAVAGTMVAIVGVVLLFLV